jgi:hypothetical protein
MRQKQSLQTMTSSFSYSLLNPATFCQTQMARGSLKRDRGILLTSSVDKNLFSKKFFLQKIEIKNCDEAKIIVSCKKNLRPALVSQL